MNEQEKQIICTAVLRILDADETLLTPAERRDVLNEICMGLCNMTLDEILNKTQNNRKLLIKRGDTANNDEYTGLSGEITMDTDTKTIRIHDGETAGGVAMARAMDIVGDWVVESQLPTAENNYTWYRKYKSGWVEMGGNIEQVPSTELTTIIFPIHLANNKYFATKTLEYFQNTTDWTGYCGGSIFDKTNTQISFRHKGPISWYVCGTLQ